MVALRAVSDALPLKEESGVDFASTGIAMNHNPHFYADDSVLETGVHMHANCRARPPHRRDLGGRLSRLRLVVLTSSR